VGTLGGPWICPKCGRVYSGLVMQCSPCNHVSVSIHTGTGYPIPRRPAKSARADGPVRDHPHAVNGEQLVPLTKLHRADVDVMGHR